MNTDTIAQAIHESIRAHATSHAGEHINDALDSVRVHCVAYKGGIYTEVVLLARIGEPHPLRFDGVAKRRLPASSVKAALLDACREAGRQGVFVSAKSDWEQRINDIFEGVKQ